MKYIATLAAAALFGAQPLYAVKADQGLPAFGELNIEDAGDVPVPVIGDAAGDDADSSNYAFSIQVQDNGNVTEALDLNNNFLVRVTRSSYGNYAAELMVDGGNATFDIR